MRLTRTLVFVSGDLCCGERLMMNGSAVFRIVPALEDGPPRQTVAEIPPAPYQVYDPPGAVDPFYVLAGLFYERFDETGARHGAFHVSPRHLDPEGRAQVDTGILLLLLDKFIGRHARNYAGTGCVTLGVTVSQTAAVRLGDLVEISSRAEGKTGEFAILTGSMRVGDLQVMSVTSSWKMIRGLAT